MILKYIQHTKLIAEAEFFFRSEHALHALHSLSFFFSLYILTLKQKERGKIHFSKHMFSPWEKQIGSSNPSSNSHRRNLLVLNDWKLSPLSNDLYKIY